MAFPWYVPIILHIVFIDLVYPWFLKGRVIDQNLLRRYFLQYLFAACFGIGVAFLFNQFHLAPVTLLVLGIGAMNGFATYNYFRAAAINLSTLSLFGFMDDVIAISLGYILLNERTFFNTGLSMGLLLSGSAAILYAWSAYQRKKSEGKNIVPIVIFFHIAIFTTLWGLATFSMRYFAIKQVDFGSFVFGWCGGSFIAACCIFLFKKERSLQDEIAAMAQKSDLGVALLSSIFIGSGILLAYWAYILAPLAVIKPIVCVSAMLIPAIVGLFVFKEGVQLNIKEKISFALAVTGIIVIAISFNG
ncbi:hypothetical protein A3J56_01755 [Candidatus Giovannonibacteria bacterium RIFCSPHIGHO2_02_FULL_46_20]|uniref:EamA domain-containing protein n=1 Tax=Candidatus Giovannonibacteria bacterium RIFCSPHIGHO2_02_FULL_46_20 TaxID=1798338 RepID=A0A1F5WEK2_9BACT|nr:MAG: hypothetical protein A3J56_01755 [Candidatus Giovannonibacteria bacterium RIFCSPHIGHO2_02_FULL_46_20]